MSRVLLIIMMVLMPINSYAQRLFIGLSGSSVAFSDNFNNTFAGKGTMSLISRSGLGFEGSVQYIKADGKEAGDPELKIVPVLIGLNYYINPHKRVTPYVGGSVGASVLNKVFDTPAFTYGGKVGLLFKVDHDLVINADISTVIVNDDKTSIDINPMIISVGVNIKIGGEKPPINKERLVKPRKRKRKRPMRRPGRY